MTPHEAMIEIADLFYVECGLTNLSRHAREIIENVVTQALREERERCAAIADDHDYHDGDLSAKRIAKKIRES